MERTKKNRILGVVMFMVTFCMAFYISKNLFKVDVEAKLRETSEKMNKDCPKLLDAETRLDKTMSLGDKTIQYNMTLVNVDKDNLQFDVNDAQAHLQSNCQKNLDSTPGMQAFRENDVTMKYFYSDKIGRRLFSFAIKPTLDKSKQKS